MLYRQSPMGSVVVLEEEDIVIFSLDKVRDIAEELGIDEEELIEKFNGVRGGLKAEGKYHISHMNSVLTSGKVVDTLMITGSPNIDDFVRFVQKNDLEFKDYLIGHEKYDPENPKANYKEIVRDYRQYLLGKVEDNVP